VLPSDANHVLEEKGGQWLLKGQRSLQTATETRTVRSLKDGALKGGDIVRNPFGLSFCIQRNLKKNSFGDRALQISNMDRDTRSGAENHLGKCLGSGPQSWLLRLWFNNTRDPASGLQ